MACQITLKLSSHQIYFPRLIVFIQKFIHIKCFRWIENISLTNQILYDIDMFSRKIQSKTKEIRCLRFSIEFYMSRHRSHEKSDSKLPGELDGFKWACLLLLIWLAECRKCKLTRLPYFMSKRNIFPHKILFLR